MISIVVPVYNAEEYIETCVQSILQQTYPEWELILIDNGSTDHSYEICRKFSHLDGRIFVFHQYRNQGVSVARNLGKEKANGEFVTFIDADDWVKKDYLETLLGICKKEFSDMVICSYESAYDANRKKVSQGSKREAQKMNKSQVKDYDIENYIEHYLLEGNTHCWGVLYHKDLLEELTFPKEITIGEDLLFLIDAALKAKKIVVTNYQGYFYYINEKGAMKKKFTSSYMDQILCWEMAMEKIVNSYPKQRQKLESIIVVSAMLVVGKISALGNVERKQYTKEVETCRELIKRYGSKGEIRKLLPKGYGLKCTLFQTMPELYMKMYGNRKRKTRGYVNGRK